MPDLAIKVENLSKLYKIGVRQEGYKTLRESIMNSLTAPWRRIKGCLQSAVSNPSSAVSGQRSTVNGQRSDNTIWALKDVSFDVKRGEVVGIIGRNGAGKTTLLRILSRITEPTEGRAEIHGRVGSLLEVGTGFHPELTGRENIYLNGAILGMRKAEIKGKFDEIVDFAEIEKFMDTPVKRYSSGMYVRLAFAVAAHLEPDILLVDEVLAVGDAVFQKKCQEKMGNVAKEGRTVLFVSHNMGAINRLCQRALWLDDGGLCMDSSAEEAVSHYLTSGTSGDGQRIWEEGIANPGVSEFKLRAISIRNNGGEITGVLDARKPFWVEIEYEILKSLPFCRVGIRITTVEGIVVFAAFDADREEYAGSREPGRFVSKCKVPGYLLNPGRFILTGVAGITGIKNLAVLENVLSVDIEDTGAAGSHVDGKRKGIIRPKLEWQVEALRQ
jgi:lipopolysaccharide transport system ATP-binding protein